MLTADGGELVREQRVDPDGRNGLLPGLGLFDGADAVDNDFGSRLLERLAEAPRILGRDAGDERGLCEQLRDGPGCRLAHGPEAVEALAPFDAEAVAERSRCPDDQHSHEEALERRLRTLIDTARSGLCRTASSCSRRSWLSRRSSAIRSRWGGSWARGAASRSSELSAPAVAETCCAWRSTTK